ncbi:MAG: MoaD/ThiS family protein [Methanobacteriaceae archaeon]
MKITLIIGEKKELKDYSDNKTIKELLDDIDMPSETVVVKKNNEIVMEDEKIENNDVIEVIKVIYGG